MALITILALEFCARTDNATGVDSLMSDFSRTVLEFGFSRFILARIPAPGENLCNSIIAETYPDGFVQNYIRQNYIEFDIIPAVAARQLRPFTWHEAREKTVRPTIDFEIEAITRDLGIQDGFAVAMRDTVGINLAVSLGSEKPVFLTPQQTKLLHMVCLHAGMRAIELQEQQRRTIKKLTEREREVLKWLAGGKTLSETADILNISFATTKTHCENARAKMGASNTTHAIVRAIRSKEIII